jgi:hypothetical protein
VKTSKRAKEYIEPRQQISDYLDANGVECEDGLYKKFSFGKFTVYKYSSGVLKVSIEDSWQNVSDRLARRIVRALSTKKN